MVYCAHIFRPFGASSLHQPRLQAHHGEQGEAIVHRKFESPVLLEAFDGEFDDGLQEQTVWLLDGAAEEYSRPVHGLKDVDAAAIELSKGHAGEDLFAVLDVDSMVIGRGFNKVSKCFDVWHGAQDMQLDFGNKRLERDCLKSRVNCDRLRRCRLIFNDQQRRIEARESLTIVDRD